APLALRLLPAGAGPSKRVRARRMIKVEHLTKYYGTTRAVENVSLDVPGGAFAARRGPNGSGKSTLMRVLTGYLSPTAGRVSVGGIDVADRPLAARRPIGAQTASEC